MTLADLRRSLYAGARGLGDVQAIRRGPKAVGRRLLRRTVCRTVYRNVSRVLRKVGL